MSKHVRIARRMASWIALLAVLLLGAPALAQEGTVQVAPATQNIAVNGTATLEVKVADAQGLYGIELTIGYDPGVMEIIGLDAGPLMPGVTPTTRADNGGGLAYFALMLPVQSGGVSGSGDVARITLRGKTEGGTLVTMEALVSDVQGASRYVSVSAVSVNVVSDASLVSTPAPIIPAPTPALLVTQPPVQGDGGQGGAAQMPPAQDTPQAGGQQQVAPTLQATPPAAAVPQAQGTVIQPLPMSTAAPDEDAPAGEPLPRWLYLTLLGTLLFGVFVVGLVVLVALYSWYRNSN